MGNSVGKGQGKDKNTLGNMKKDRGREDKNEKEKKVKKHVMTDPGVLSGRMGKDATHINLFVWLRVMTQQLQAEQIHRSAATRLMFESAAAGTLTHPYVTERVEGGGGHNRQGGGTGTLSFFSN